MEINNVNKELMEVIKKEKYMSILCCKISAFGTDFGILRIHMCNGIRLWQTSEIALIISLCDLLAVLLHSKELSFDDMWLI